MTDPRALHEQELVKAIPHLRAFARTFCSDPARADDLVQETLIKAWKNLHSFQTGTNFKAWLFTILRNAYFSEFRKRKREVDDPDETHTKSLAVSPEQPGHLDLADLRVALSELPVDQREALLLVGAEGFSYEEAAQICGCAVGTVKSRVNRARKRLAELLHLESTDDINPKPMLGTAGSGRRAAS